MWHHLAPSLPCGGGFAAGGALLGSPCVGMDWQERQAGDLRGKSEFIAQIMGGPGGAEALLRARSKLIFTPGAHPELQHCRSCLGAAVGLGGSCAAEPRGLSRRN